MTIVNLPPTDILLTRYNDENSTKTFGKAVEDLVKTIFRKYMT